MDSERPESQKRRLSVDKTACPLGRSSQRQAAFADPQLPAGKK